jgi:hypothetical protein
VREDTPSQTTLTAAPSQTLIVGVRRWAGNARSEQPNRMVRVDRLVPRERACDDCEQLTESHQHCNSGHSRGSPVTSGSPVAVSGAGDGLRAESVSCCAVPDAAAAVEVLTFQCSLSQVAGLRLQRSKMGSGTAVLRGLPTLARVVGSSPDAARPLSDANGDDVARRRDHQDEESLSKSSTSGSRTPRSPPSPFVQVDSDKHFSQVSSPWPELHPNDLIAELNAPFLKCRSPR